jgi:NAD(P)-dependent dehydrogenase (short-subunit alcohol dehydrogenase family)
MVARVVTARRVAVVTGSASGIGLATMRRAADVGYAPVGFDVAPVRPDRQTAARSGGRAVEVDVTSASAVRSAVDEVEAEIGPIAVVVTAAGALEERPFSAVDRPLWDTTLRLLLGGTRNVVIAAARHMAARRSGSIVAISSELAFLGAEDHVHYVAAKAAVVGLVRAAARELAATNVRINCVAPGPTDTPLLGPSGRDPGYVQSIPLRRLGRPEEVALAILDIAQWTWSTGQVYAVNGGSVIR